MTPEKQEKSSELSKHWSANSKLARNEVIMKRTYPVKIYKYPVKIYKCPVKIYKCPVKIYKYPVKIYKYPVNHLNLETDFS